MCSASKSSRCVGASVTSIAATLSSERTRDVGNTSACRSAPSALAFVSRAELPTHRVTHTDGSRAYWALSSPETAATAASGMLPTRSHSSKKARIDAGSPRVFCAARSAVVKRWTATNGAHTDSTKATTELVSASAAPPSSAARRHCVCTEAGSNDAGGALAQRARIASNAGSSMNGSSCAAGELARVTPSSCCAAAMPAVPETRRASTSLRRLRSADRSSTSDHIGTPSSVGAPASHANTARSSWSSAGWSTLSPSLRVMVFRSPSQCLSSARSASVDAFGRIIRDAEYSTRSARRTWASLTPRKPAPRTGRSKNIPSVIALRNACVCAASCICGRYKYKSRETTADVRCSPHIERRIRNDVARGNAGSTSGSASTYSLPSASFTPRPSLKVSIMDAVSTVSTPSAATLSCIGSTCTQSPLANLTGAARTPRAQRMSKMASSS
mmetsp:Transcript_15112/g.46858  ORF Transcript_15112/g.46858 Transcript_15112/m.46858 type:complete len:444 (-) Transcript_15112:1650-2981(-)